MIKSSLKKLLQNLTKKEDDTPLNPEVEGFYEVVALPDKPEAWCIKIVKGPWEGIIYTYGEVNLENVLTPKIQYEILWAPRRFSEQEFNEEEEKDFHTLLGKIAMNIIYEDAGELFTTESGKFGLKK